ncbi:Protein phosphatase 2C [Artemisia annua]|uniref:Protein phosphatase 2C n=1 Tax=Artemisia annua TaxID=35608 RepID=A0A2U1K9K2_ARTAN|nr:Protein phosphatase 2C [Artemisia annua]
MRDEDVYVMNLGDSRAIVAQHAENKETGSSQTGDNGTVVEGVANESTNAEREVPDQDVKLTALQLSTDHSTSIEEEVTRIKNEHPDDNHCIVNDRVKGRLKVTRAFGAGSLKQAKWNDSLLEMFRNEFIGDAPYISCLPSLRHHQLCPRDQFLILSSDGLYQYFSNKEVVSHVDIFMDKFPDGDPAQHLIEELLLRAAKKAGMDLHELLDIPQGDRRKYHDDVTVMVISLEGRIWKSSGKYL